jgi:MYXO-CTERM domain-containing protein
VQNHGAAPGVPWARWVRNRQEMPPRAATQYGPAEGPYTEKLVALQIGDETALNDDNVRNDYVNWYNEIRAANPAWLPHTILYNNSAGGAVSDVALDDFIRRAQPDMIVFDSYRHFQPGRAEGPSAWPGGSPTPYYSDMRRYRQHAVMGHGLPLGVYRQTFHDAVFRDLSRSEFRLESFAPLAFGAKFLTDFTYNTGASSYFNGPGDTNPTPLYAELADVNKEVRNLGQALVRLKPVNDVSMPDLRTTNIQFIQGSHRTSPTTTAFNPLPIGFTADAQSAGTSDWEFARNDPYLSGWGVTNLGTTNEGLDGDVMLSWFTPIDESLDGPAHSNQIYLMVTNGLTDPSATPEATRQQITLTFGSSSVFFPYNTLERLDRETGQVEIVDLNRISTNRAQLVLQLDGGTSDLFKFPTGAPFVGVPEPAAMGVLGLGALALRRQRTRPASR